MRSFKKNACEVVSIYTGDNGGIINISTRRYEIFNYVWNTADV